MSSAPDPDEIWKDATWLAQAIDPTKKLVRFVEMTADSYRAASFLDDRMLQNVRNAHLLNWDDVAGAMPGAARPDARWIFHIGHVGSTLVSRLLGELDDVLAVREPRALRDLTFFPAEVRAIFVPTLQALLSRTFEPDEVAIVKATSFVGEIAAELAGPENRALLLYATPASYIAGILAGENSRKELTGLAETRRHRLSSRGIDLPEARNDAELAAAAWACEMTALEAAADGGASARWANFDLFLEDVEGSLSRFGDFFGLEASPEQFAAIARGPLMGLYSKATEYEYSPGLRRQLLTDAAAEHRDDIERALAMLVSASETAPLLKRALDRARAES